MSRVAVVGANRGIGLEFCKQLSKQNEVVAFCRHSNEELEALGVQVIENCEVTNLESLETAVDRCEGQKFDYLIHVAGILRPNTLEELNVEDISEQFKVNSLGPLLCVHSFLSLLNPGAKVGLLTSRMGSIADNDSGGYYGYRMSKAALNAAGKSLAEDLKPRDISVFLLHPGYVRTDMTGFTGLIDPDESVKGLWRILQEKGMEQTGTFWHTNGEQLPW